VTLNEEENLNGAVKVEKKKLNELILIKDLENHEAFLTFLILGSNKSRTIIENAMLLSFSDHYITCLLFLLYYLTK